MMNKMVKKIFFILVFLVIVAIVILLFLFSQRSQENRLLDGNDINSIGLEGGNSSIVSDDNQENQEDVMLKKEDTRPAVDYEPGPSPFPELDLDLTGVEFMSDQEKKDQNIPVAIKAQVIERTDKGYISSYKVIRVPEDIEYSK